MSLRTYDYYEDEGYIMEDVDIAKKDWEPLSFGTTVDCPYCGADVDIEVDAVKEKIKVYCSCCDKEFFLRTEA